MATVIRVGIAVLADLLIYELNQLQHKKNAVLDECGLIREWIKRRNLFGASATFLKEVELEDPETFRNHLRLTTNQFQELLSVVEHSIKKKDTLMGAALEHRIKLQITLRYLATGDSFSTLEHMYRIPKTTISKFLPQAIAKGFEDRWQFPKCCGALDGKHVNIQCPNNSHSDFYNYRGFFSTILFALVDSNYCFIYINIGTNGRANDSTVLRNSSLKTAIENESVGFPTWGVIVGDDAFSLKDYLMKPYSRHGRLSNAEKVFNYRLSRARRIVENAFGILAMRFRVFRSPILSNPEKVDDIVKGTCAIHNWLRQTSPNSYMPITSIDREDENG